MATNNKKRNRKIFNLITICALFAIVLSVGTFAWFIGIQTVDIQQFEIEVETTEGLLISMDGENWQYTLDVNTANQYAGNTNILDEGSGFTGLKPISTVGRADSTSSRMIMFEKASLTSGYGGLRLLTSRVDNYNKSTEGDDGLNQGDGYIAFDLFIKNISEDAYYTDNEPLNEEAIFLSTNSAVTTSANGVAGTGIENSIRVAFMQVGRVISTNENPATITGITCTSGGAGDDQVTGICRDAVIWEPNDSVHVQNAIEYYNVSCKERIAEDIYVDGYNKEGTCEIITTNQAVSTYAVNKELVVDDMVDTYDGFNKYDDTITSYTDFVDAEDGVKDEYKLVDYDYFTDTEKVKTGNDRPQFMSLAPNSITKVRVYVYLEGQDIDNYEFASLGEEVTINFGFTKERYTAADVDHVGEDVDTTPTAGI